MILTDERNRMSVKNTYFESASVVEHSADGARPHSFQSLKQTNKKEIVFINHTQCAKLYAALRPGNSFHVNCKPLQSGASVLQQTHLSHSLKLFLVFSKLKYSSSFRCADRCFVVVLGYEYHLLLLIHCVITHFKYHYSCYH